MDGVNNSFKGWYWLNLMLPANLCYLIFGLLHMSEDMFSIKLLVFLNSLMVVLGIASIFRLSKYFKDTYASSKTLRKDKFILSYYDCFDDHLLYSLVSISAYLVVGGLMLTKWLLVGYLLVSTIFLIVYLRAHQACYSSLVLMLMGYKYIQISVVRDTTPSWLLLKAGYRFKRIDNVSKFIYGGTALKLGDPATGGGIYLPLSYVDYKEDGKVKVQEFINQGSGAHDD